MLSPYSLNPQTDYAQLNERAEISSLADEKLDF